MTVAPLVFEVRWEVIDSQLLRTAVKHNHQGTLAEAEARTGFDAVLLSEIVTVTDVPSRYFGEKTTLFWRLVYELFVGTGAVAHPHGFSEPKSVLGADVYERPIEWGGTAYISVWAEPHGQPVLVPFPHVPAALMKRGSGATFGESCRAYRALVAEIVARVNLVVPAALLLAQYTDTTEAG